MATQIPQFPVINGLPLKDCRQVLGVYASELGQAYEILDQEQRTQVLVTLETEHYRYKDRSNPLMLLEVQKYIEAFTFGLYHFFYSAQDHRRIAAEDAQSLTLWQSHPKRCEALIFCDIWDERGIFADFQPITSDTLAGELKVSLIRAYALLRSLVAEEWAFEIKDEEGENTGRFRVTNVGAHQASRLRRARHLLSKN